MKGYRVIFGPSWPGDVGGARTIGDGRQSGHSDEGEGDMTGIPIMPCEMKPFPQPSAWTQSLILAQYLHNAIMDAADRAERIVRTSRRMKTPSPENGKWLFHEPTGRAITVIIED